jgi:hypothetical protein
MGTPDPCWVICLNDIATKFEQSLVIFHKPIENVGHRKRCSQANHKEVKDLHASERDSSDLNRGLLLYRIKVK